MNSTQKDQIMLDALLMVVKIIAFHDHASGERYQKMCQNIFGLLCYCVNFNALSINEVSEFLDATFGSLKMQIMQKWRDDKAEALNVAVSDEATQQ